MMSLHLAPCTRAQANDFVRLIHRHNGPLPSAIFHMAVYGEDAAVRGIALAGMPKARVLCTPGTLEVSRVATDGTRNACSMLYGACTRAARALGYRRLITYTLEREAGASLRASGWALAAEVKGEGWARRRASIGDLNYMDQHDVGDKWRWEIQLGEPLPNLTWPSMDAAYPTFDFDEGA
jgi:hypothetical protein